MPCKTKKQKETKVSKCTEPEILSSPIDDSVYAREAEIKNYHDTSGPYKHIVIDNFCTHNRMLSIFDEVKSNMNATFKETDLFKVYQTNDFGNLNPNDEVTRKNMPQILALREAIYAPKFREFVSRVTGCGDLTDRVDLSCNAYPQSGHLLCHDDVIGTRKISFIMYFTDPDEPWTERDGGALELYPMEESSLIDRGEALGGIQGIPVPSPTLSLLPLFNRIAFFVVQPGRSYHSVQEVYNENPRMSISGWYHTPEPPPGSDFASLSQIMKKSFKQVPLDPIVKVDSDNDSLTIPPTVKDLALLKKYVWSNYLSPSIWENIRKQFEKTGSLQLLSFLKPELSQVLEEATSKCDDMDNVGNGEPALRYEVGIDEEWKVIGPPHLMRYLRYSPSDKMKKSKDPHHIVGSTLQDIRQNLFASTAFARFLYAITGMVVDGVRQEVRRFRAGYDYTVAHFGLVRRREYQQNAASNAKSSNTNGIACLDVTLCFVSVDADETEDVWGDGEVGGFDCYVPAEADESTEAAEVYKRSSNVDGEDEESNKATADGSSDALLSVSPRGNVLSIVARSDKWMRFVKYVSAFAPSSRWDLAAEYDIVSSEDAEEEQISGSKRKINASVQTDVNAPETKKGSASKSNQKTKKNKK